MKSGAQDYLVKGNMTPLRLAIHNVVERALFGLERTKSDFALPLKMLDSFGIYTSVRQL